MSVNIFKNGQLKKIAGNVRDTDTADSTVAFDSGDQLNPTTPADVALITSGETHKSLLHKLSSMARNVRYLLKIMGNVDISNISDGTVTGALREIKMGMTPTVVYGTRIEDTVPASNLTVISKMTLTPGAWIVVANATFTTSLDDTYNHMIYVDSMQKVINRALMKNGGGASPTVIVYSHENMIVESSVIQFSAKEVVINANNLQAIRIGNY